MKSSTCDKSVTSGERLVASGGLLFEIGFGEKGGIAGDFDGIRWRRFDTEIAEDRESPEVGHVQS